MKPLSLYIHFPFCIQKCHYCDFLSFPLNTDSGNDPGIAAYIRDLKREILCRSAFYKEYHVVSIFFGGGTPSIMTVPQISDLMNLLTQSFHIDMQAEITCECNPGTLTGEKLQGLYTAGINRLSIGLQSCSDRELGMLGRIHQYRHFLENYDQARKTGFQNINIDLMSALPGQSIASYKDTLQKVLALNPEHISAYSLIIEEGTPFAEKLPAPLPSEDDEREMYYLTKQMLHEHGYERYEISNYARTGFECRHNTAYWIRQDYLGLGLGSSSLIDNHRFSNPTDFSVYHDGCQNGFENVVSEEFLTMTEQMEEFMFLGLRLTRGISAKAFMHYFQKDIEEIYGSVIRKHINDKTLEYKDDYLRLTQKGLDVANYVMSDFIL